MPKLSHFFTKMGVNVGFSVQYSIQIIQSRGFKGIGFKPKRFKRIGFNPRAINELVLKQEDLNVWILIQ